MFIPFAFMKSSGGSPPSPSLIPTGSMIAWYDASDYTSGTTWVDKSSNGLDLTLNGTYSKDASTIGGESILLNTGYAVSDVTNLLPGVNTSGDSEFTIIEIVKPNSISSAQGTLAMSTNAGGEDADSASTLRVSPSDVGFVKNASGGEGFRLNNAFYDTSATSFVARRFLYGGTPGTAGGCVWGYGDTFQGLTFYTSAGDYDITGAFAFVDFGSGNLGRVVIGAATYQGSYRTSGYYVASLWYNRLLSDSEIQDIYTYYQNLGYNLA
jgi:hypothetical protein